MGFQLIAAAWYTEPAAWFGLLQAVLGLGFVIFVHEAGHFLVAKACGVKCEKFYVGFDVPIKLGFGKYGIQLPASLWKKQWGETVYGIGIIPLGGYVKMLGQDDNPAKYREMQEKSRLAQAEQEATGDDAASQTNTAAGDGDSGAEEFALDPRSYMAKSVPARMAIISAGVIMNLIFAVLFAATAYYFGAPIQPTIIDSTTPGTPAWVTNFPLGGKIIQITKHGRNSEYLRYGMDLSQVIALWDTERDGEIKFLVRYPGGEEKWHALTPQIIEIEGEGEISQAGMGSSSTTTLAAKKFLPEHMPVPTKQATEPFMGSDKIVAVKVGDKRFDTPDYPALAKQFARHRDAAITIVVEREIKKEKSAATVENTEDAKPETKTIEIVVGRRARRSPGFSVTIGAVTAIRENSPAVAAGFKVDDVIQAVNGEPVYNPLTLSDLLRRQAGQEVTVTVLRGEKDKQTPTEIKITPELPDTFARQPGRHNPSVGLESIGVAIGIENVVSHVDPGTPAAEMLEPGDQVLDVVFVSDTEEGMDILEDLGFPEIIDLKKIYANWYSVDTLMQNSPAGTKIKITRKRGTETKTVQLALIESDDWSLPSRGVLLKPAVSVHTATSLGNAFALGLRQTKEDAFRVFRFLRKLVTGRVSPKMLGGPITIGAVATSEATRDFRLLLLFLTLLSANLAVINFLPIPVLDGGHMVFLILEGIFRRPVSEKIVIPLTYLGLFLILGLMLFVFSRDINRFIL